MRRRIEKLPGPEQLAGKGWSEKPAAAAGRAVKNEHTVANAARRVLLRPPDGGVVNAQLRHDGSVGELEVADDEIALLSRRRPRGASIVSRCGPSVLRSGDRRAQGERGEAQQGAHEPWGSYDPRRPDFIDVAGGLPALTGGGGGGASGWSLVGSAVADAGCCGPFFFFEKSGISFFFFMLVSVQEEQSVLDLVELSPKVSERMRGDQEGTLVWD
jgi:hypothetical protein